MEDTGQGEGTGQPQAYDGTVANGRCRHRFGVHTGGGQFLCDTYSTYGVLL